MRNADVTRCVLCGGADPIALGFCPSCARDDSTSLIFAGRGARREQAKLAVERLGIASASATDIDDVRRGARPLLALAGVSGIHAAAHFASIGIPVRAVARDRAWREIPAAYLLMVACVLGVGVAAGLRVAPLLLPASPLAAALLLWAAWHQLRRPILSFQPSSVSLPGDARAALTIALSEIPDGSLRNRVLEIAHLSETALDSMSSHFRSADLGRSVCELATTAAETAVEAWRLECIADAPSSSAAQQSRALEQAWIVRLDQLDRAAGLLGEIGRQAIESPESASARIRELLGEVRNNADDWLAARTAVAAALR